MRENKNDFTHGEDVQMLIGDCIESMRSLPDNSVHMCVTSPPYWGQRDYGNDGQIGLEKGPEEFIEKLVNVFREVRRVLRDDGTLWLNLGDTYASGKARYSHREHSMLGGTRNDGKLGALQDGKRACVKGHEFLKDKDLIGIPWRVALALQRDGWWLRQDIIWAKPNCMPESVKDRCTKNHEYVFLLTKSASYFYDNEAIKVPIKGEVHSKKNKRSVWTVSPKAFKGSHFAVYPPELIEPCILAGTSAGGCCSKCGSPYDRITEIKDIGVTVTIGWQPMCECDTDSIPCTVLDPFGGSGTTAAVALKHHRKSIMCELNPEYASLMPKRIKEITGMASGQKRLFGGDWGF